MANNVTLDGNPIEIDGKFPQPGDNAAPFTLTSSGLEEVKLDNWAGKRKILNIIPSIDTGVCAASTRKFNEKAGSLDNTVVLVVSVVLLVVAVQLGRFVQFREVVPQVLSEVVVVEVVLVDVLRHIVVVLVLVARQHAVPVLNFDRTVANEANAVVVPQILQILQVPVRLATLRAADNLSHRRALVGGSCE